MTTKLKPIRSEADYEAALSVDVARLWGAKAEYG